MGIGEENSVEAAKLRESENNSIFDKVKKLQKLQMSFFMLVLTSNNVSLLFVGREQFLKVRRGVKESKVTQNR